MTRSELVVRLIAKNQEWQYSTIDSSIRAILEQMTQALENGDRVEVRGFGSFSLHYRPSRIGRNPKTGENVELSAKYVPHFKAGKTLKERVANAPLS